MNPSASACQPDLLKRWLSDQLDEPQEETLALHLSECRTCRAELEHLAAEQTTWQRITDLLRHSSVSMAQGSDVPQSGDPPLRQARIHSADPDSDAEFATDFAVDFLDPSPTKGGLGRLGDIEILEVIGQGGMGIVLKGFQSELNRYVAVKMLAPHLATSGAARKRFAREAQATAAVVHPNVMPILTVNSATKLPYLVMPYVACESLQQRITREGGLPVADLLRIGVQVARGLAAAHAQGLIHRDVKPANILLEKGVDRVMLTDFGLARAVDDASLTRSGVIAGTPQYMSPEQARGEAVDARSDLFSFGSVLYAMSTGRPPFRAETSYGILRRVTDSAPRPIRELNPEIPEWLERLISELLAKNRDERFPDAASLAELLEDCLAHVQHPTRAPLPARLGVVQHQTLRRVFKIIAAMLFSVLLILVAMLWQGPEDKQAPVTLPKPLPVAAVQPETPPKTADIAPPLTLLAPWDTPSAAEIDTLLEEVQQLEHDIQQPWSPSPAVTNPQ